MNESEWFNATSPRKMLEFLEGKVSDRKLRLFACACCRSLWQRLEERCFRDAVEATEKYADGRMAVEALTSASEAAWDTKDRLEEVETEDEDDEVVFSAASAVAQASCGPGNSDILYIFRAIDVASFTAEARGLTRKDQAHLLREVLGNPFRHAAVAPVCRTPTVLALAQAAYDRRDLPSGTLDPAHLAILADALEEADCTDADILGHLRAPGPHVRGCFALDSILGKS